MASHRRTRLRVRLCLLFTSIIALLMAGQAAYVSYTTAKASRRSQREVLSRDAERLAARLGASGSLEATLPGLRAEGLFTGTTLRQVLTLDGTVLEASDALRGDGSLIDEEGLRRISRRGSELVITQRNGRLPAHAVMAPTTPPVVVVAMAPQDWATVQRQRLLRFELLVIPVGTLIGAALAWFTVGHQLRRVGLIVRAASAVAAGQRGVTGAVGPRDELFAMSTALTEITATLRSALDYQQRFAAQAAHELRTPLTIMKTEAELAISSGSLEETQRALSSIGEETERLSVLVQHLLAFGQTASPPVPMEDVAAAELVESAIQPLIHFASERGVRLAVEDVDGGALKVSRVGIEHALRNLVENAISAAPAGSDVRISAVQDGAHWCFGVEDRGVGVEAALGDRIFEPFVGARNGGHGLGLAFVKLIAEAHDGRATVDRRADGTTRFALLLPASVASRCD